jgi:hypothetical protein
MAWQRLSERLAASTPDGPYEDVPEHLRYVLCDWFMQAVGRKGSSVGLVNETAVYELGVRFRLPVQLGQQPWKLADSMVEAGLSDSAFFLDLIDCTLDVLGSDRNRWQLLDKHLKAGASVWRTNEQRNGLTRVVSDEAQATFDAATAQTDGISTELKEAWANALGRNGDPSDAWDHAIKALENLLIPIVVPNQQNATLGSVLGQLRNQGHLWKTVLPGKTDDNDVGPLVGMLEGIWPNIDRHGGTGPTRPPTEQEARAVVTLAATIVQWHRDGWVLQRR